MTHIDQEKLERELAALCKKHGAMIQQVIGERLTMMMLLQVLAEEPEFKRIMASSACGILITMGDDGVPIISIAPDDNVVLQ